MKKVVSIFTVAFMFLLVGCDEMASKDHKENRKLKPENASDASNTGNASQQPSSEKPTNESDSQGSDTSKESGSDASKEPTKTGDIPLPGVPKDPEKPSGNPKDCQAAACPQDFASTTCEYKNISEWGSNECVAKQKVYRKSCMLGEIVELDKIKCEQSQ